MLPDEFIINFGKEENIGRSQRRGGKKDMKLRLPTLAVFDLPVGQPEAIKNFP